MDLQNSDTWKIQLTIVINFISSKDAEEERVMNSWGNNIKLTSYNDANEKTDEIFESLRSSIKKSQKYQWQEVFNILLISIYIFNYRNRWMCKKIQKILLQEKYLTVFLVAIQRQLYGILII